MSYTSNHFTDDLEDKLGRRITLSDIREEMGYDRNRSLEERRAAVPSSPYSPHLRHGLFVSGCQEDEEPEIKWHFAVGHFNAEGEIVTVHRVYWREGLTKEQGYAKAKAWADAHQDTLRAGTLPPPAPPALPPGGDDMNAHQGEDALVLVSIRDEIDGRPVHLSAGYAVTARGVVLRELRHGEWQEVDRASTEAEGRTIAERLTREAHYGTPTRGPRKAGPPLDFENGGMRYPDRKCARNGNAPAC